MKTLRFFYLLLCGIMLQGLTCWGYAQSPIPGYDDFPVPIDAAHFPDIHFREYVSQEYDTDSDGAISLEEAGKVLCIDIADRASLSSLKGVKYFFLLDTLDCSSNALTSLDVSSLTALTSLDCSSNVLASLDVSGCTALTSLDCDYNYLTSLDVSGCTALTSLDCDNNALTSLDVSGCTALTSLDCDYNYLTSLDVSGCTALTSLDCDNNALTSLDVSGCTALTSLNCGYNYLTSLDVSGCTALTSLDCYGNDLTSLDVSSLTALTSLNCYGNDLTSLDVSSLTALTSLNCYGNYLTSLDVSSLTALTSLNCDYNYLTSLDVSSLTALTSLDCDNNALTSLDVSGCTALTSLNCGHNDLTSLDVSGLTALTSLNCYGNALTSLDVSGCTALTRLDCGSNALTSLDVSDCTALKYLSCFANNLYSLDLSSNPNMVQVDVSWNVRSVRVRSNGEFDLAYLLGLEIDRISSLTGGYLSGTMLDFSEDQVRYEYNTGCGEVEFCLRKLPAVSIDMYNFPDSVFRRYVVENCDWIQDGYLTEEEILSVVRMDVSGMGIHNLQGIEYFTFLESLDCSDNHLTSLDLSSNTRLRDLQADSNCLDVKVDDEKCFDLRGLPGFDLSKVSGWEGGYVEDSILYFEEEMVTYSYVVDNGGFEDVVFMLRTDFPVLIPINNETFPDEAFRAYVSENIDVSHDGNLNEGEINSVTTMDVSGMGIHNLQGIEYFTFLESLDCSDNHLTSLDLSSNTRLRDLQADSNCLDVKVDDEKCFDLRGLPGFDMSKVSGWEGGYVEDSILYFEEEMVTYSYVVDNGGFEDVVFMLRTDFPVLIPINNETFPDEAFRAYVSENVDVSHNGNLNEGEINSVTTMDVSGLGIRSLQGMEYFTALESLDCSDNELTSLDLLANTNLQDLDAEDNRLNVVLDGNDAFDLSFLPNFDIDRASDWNGAVLDGNMLTFTQQEVTYQYSTAYARESGDESLKSVMFTLVADRDPSIEPDPDPDPDVANEDVNVSHGRVYAKGRTIFTEGISGEVSVFTAVGTLVYQGKDTRIPVHQAGTYIVRHGEQVWKILVM